MNKIEKQLMDQKKLEKKFLEDRLLTCICDEITAYADGLVKSSKNMPMTDKMLRYAFKLLEEYIFFIFKEEIEVNIINGKDITIASIFYRKIKLCELNIEKIYHNN